MKEKKNLYENHDSITFSYFSFRMLPCACTCVCVCVVRLWAWIVQNSTQRQASLHVISDQFFHSYVYRMLIDTYSHFTDRRTCPWIYDDIHFDGMLEIIDEYFPTFIEKKVQTICCGKFFLACLKVWFVRCISLVFFFLPHHRLNWKLTMSAKKDVPIRFFSLVYGNFFSG